MWFCSCCSTLAGGGRQRDRLCQPLLRPQTIRACRSRASRGLGLARCFAVVGLHSTPPSNRAALRISSAAQEAATALMAGLARPLAR